MTFWTTVFAIWTAVAIPVAALPVVRILIRAGKSVFIWAFADSDAVTALWERGK